MDQLHKGPTEGKSMRPWCARKSGWLCVNMMFCALMTRGALLGNTLLLEETQHSSLWAAVTLHIKCSDNITKLWVRLLLNLAEHQHIESTAPTVAERQALAVLADGTLKHQFVVGVRDEWVRHELR